jgi:branched-chain amino acid aminotransferase
MKRKTGAAAAKGKTAAKQKPAAAPRRASTHAVARPPFVWVNGRRIGADEPAISALDRGFTLADGVFETIRVYGGAPFMFAQHLARLARGAATLHIDVPSAFVDYISAALGHARGSGLVEAALRVTLTRGVGDAPGLAPPPASDTRGATFVVTLHEAPVFPAELRARGITARVASMRRNEYSPLSDCKTLSFTDAIAALAEARAGGADDAILLDTRGHVSEASASNVFVVSDDALVTPPRSCGVLPGITRNVVMEIADSLGIAVEERALELDELRMADEAFLTSTLREIAPLVAIDGSAIGGGAPGGLTQVIMREYASYVQQDLE